MGIAKHVLIKFLEAFVDTIGSFAARANALSDAFCRCLQD